MIVLFCACFIFVIACALAPVVGLVSRRYTGPIIECGGAVALLWIWLNGCGAFNAVYLRLLVPAPWPVHLSAPDVSPEHPLAIVLLGGGTERVGPDRQFHPAGDSIEKVALTASLYQQAAHRSVPLRNGVTVIVSGGDPQKHGVAEADNYAPDLISLGVPPDVVVRENKSLNTFQNALFVAAILKERQYAAVGTTQSLVLVTTAIHMRRALLDFGRQGLHPIPIAPPVHTLHSGFWPTALRLGQAEADLHELIGIVQFYVYRQLGWY